MSNSTEILEREKLDYLEFHSEKDIDGYQSVWLWGFGTYPESSVLAGQPRQVRLECFDNVAQAKAAHPEVAVFDYPVDKVTVSLPETPPDWFDPMAAGEEW